ncbi:hypothetical protein T439DRAFT_288432 [Meredithblackwellia eburnea MCA 4105]
MNDFQPATPTTARPQLTQTSSSRETIHTAAKRRHASSKSQNLSISVPRGNSYGEEEGGEKTLNGNVNTAVPVVVPRAQVLAGFPSLEEALQAVNGTVDQSLVFSFWQLFATHCSSLLENVRAFRFDHFELSLRSWWSSLDANQRTIVHCPGVSELIYRADAAVYNDVLEFLHAQLLVNLPSQTFLNLRGLADNMERIMTSALSTFNDPAFQGPKVELAARFGHLVTRHLGLCQLAQALTGIVSNSVTLSEMANAWDEIDFEAIKNQSALVSNCEHSFLEDCFSAFRKLLKSPGPVPIESFIRWADQCFDRCISPPQTSAAKATSPRSLLIRWSFVTSQIMRDLTLRSAPSFGSFAIASIFLDEFLGFQVSHIFSSNFRWTRSSYCYVN